MKYVEKFKSYKLKLSKNVLRLVFFCAIIYLILPQLLFVSFAFKTYLVPFFIGAMVCVLVFFWKSIAKFDFTVEMPVGVFCFAEILMVLVLLLSGVGGFCGVQAGDYSRSNAVLGDLINYKWPVIYKIDEKYYALNYYIGYFIPGALIGKIFASFRIGEVVMFLWSLIGLNMAFLLFSIINRGASIKMIWAFFCWAGLDCIGYVITSHSLFWGTQHLEHWANVVGVPNGHIANYQSVATGLLWSIQHYIPAMIATPMLLHSISAGNYKICLFISCALLFWSPLLVVGIVPFAIFFFIYEKCDWRKFISLANVFAVIFIAFPIILYYKSMDLSAVSGRKNVVRGVTWFFDNWPVLFLFSLLEFGIVAYLLYNALPEKMDKNLILISAFTMFVSLFIDYGLCHDFSMRATIIPWIVLFTCFAKALKNPNCKLYRYLIIYLIGASCTSFTEYSRILKHFFMQPFAVERVMLPGNTIKDWDRMRFQYLGNPNHFFYKYFCKNSSLKENKQAYYVFPQTDVNWNSGVDTVTNTVLLFSFDESILQIINASNSLECVTFDNKKETFKIDSIYHDENWIRVSVDHNAKLCAYPSSIYFYATRCGEGD